MADLFSSKQNPSTFRIAKVGVLGAGVMGAQIAAHCVNAGLPVRLFDLTAHEGEKSVIAKKAIEQLKKLKPAALAHPQLAESIQAANYDEHLAQLSECDLVIEAIAERLDWKQDLYHRIVPNLASHALLASNTSGLSIESLSHALPSAMRARFCGIHFFNPPRFMPLVEIIPTQACEAILLDKLETFLVSKLGKWVVRARDTPNFIGNRIGVFGILAAMINAEKFRLSFEQVDELTGKHLGRAKSGTFRTIDVIGLDTLAHIVRTLQQDLPHDPFRAHFAMPCILADLIEQGHLGQKTGAGFYCKKDKSILRWDKLSKGYVPTHTHVDDEVIRILSERDPAARLNALRHCVHPQAQFVWALLRDTFHYSAVQLAAIAQTARDIDLAMRAGFAHQQGPFEIWQAAGWQIVAQWIQEDINQGKALCSTPLPDWVSGPSVVQAKGVHTAQGSWNPQTHRFEPRSHLPVYSRQLFPLRLEGESPKTALHTVFENESIHLWTLPKPYPDQILIASFKTKMHVLSQGVLEGLMHAVELAENQFLGLVIWQTKAPFCAGANLQAMLSAFQQGKAYTFEVELIKLQDTVRRLRDAQVPTVAALNGVALGGGCELALYCAHRVAHIDTQIGLVEMGVGLIPAGGGLAYCAHRAADQQALIAPELSLPYFLKKFVQAITHQQVSKSALEAQHMGYLRQSDTIVMNIDELLFVAVEQAQALANTGWHPPLPLNFPVAGRNGITELMASIIDQHKAGLISDYDFELSGHIVQILCGGQVEAGKRFNEQQLLDLERQVFLNLLTQTKTQERIASLLKKI